MTARPDVCDQGPLFHRHRQKLSGARQAGSRGVGATWRVHSLAGRRISPPMMSGLEFAGVGGRGGDGYGLYCRGAGACERLTDYLADVSRDLGSYVLMASRSGALQARGMPFGVLHTNEMTKRWLAVWILF